MPQLALAVVGGAIGGAVGGTFLGVAASSWGFAAGSAIGGALFAPTMKSQGPRLSDLRATQVAYGSVIPYVEGHPRVPGSVVWNSAKREIATTTEQGGKGGGGVDVTTYTYEQDVLFMLAENIVESIRRMWWNGELVWSAANESDLETLLATQTTEKWTRMTFYSGAADQLPDPTYEAAVGVGNAPAYRGRATIFFEGLQLGSSGQLPALTFEIVQGSGGVREDVRKLLSNFGQTDLANTVPPGGAVFSDDGFVRIPGYIDGGGSSAPKVVIYYGDGDPSGGDGGDDGTTFPTGGAAGAVGQGGGDRPFMVFGGYPGMYPYFAIVGDGVSVKVDLPVNEYIGSSEVRWATWNDVIAVGSSASIGTGLNQPQGTAGYAGSIFLHTITGTYLGQISHGAACSSIAMNGSAVYALTSGMVTQYNSTTFASVASFAAPSGSNRRIFISKQGTLCCANAAGDVHTWNGSAWELLLTLDSGDSTDLGTDYCIHVVDRGSVYAIRTMTYSAPQPRIQYVWSYRTSTAPDPTVYYYDNFIDAVKDGVGTHWWGPAPNGYNPWVCGAMVNGPRPKKNPTYTIEELNTGNFYGSTSAPYAKLSMTVDVYEQGCDGSPDGWYTRTQTAISGAVWIYQVNVNPTSRTYRAHDVWRQLVVESIPLVEPTLQDVVERQCERAGLDLGYVDASELATRNVHAMVLSQMTSPRACIEFLSSGYLFQSVESGGTLKFKFRGGASVADIPYEDLVGGEDEPLPITKANDAELPVQFFVKYSNLYDDYQDGSEASDRLDSTTQNTSQVEFPLGFTPTEAKRIAEALVQDGPASQFRFGPFSLTRKWAALEPTDVVTLNDAAGNVFRARLTKRTDTGGLLTFEAVSDDAEVVQSDAVTTDSGYKNSTQVRLPVDTEVELLDMPLLQDSDDDVGFYAAAKQASGDTFPGAVLFKSTDDVTYTAAARFEAAAVFGEATTVLGSGSAGYFDEKNTVTVDVGDGELSSTTWDAMLSSTDNVMLLGSEVIQFRTATLVSAGVYTLSGLLRGLKGTEWAVGTHAIGETAVLLNTALRRVTQANSEVGVSEYWKAVTVGRSAATADAETFTNNAASKKPYAPVDVRVARDTSGNITITLQRRSRLSTRLIGSSGMSCPLGEQDERYEIDVFASNAYSTLKRTLSMTSTRSVSYTSSQQVTDFGSNQSTIYIKAYQLSAVVGRGYAATVSG